MGVSVSTGIFLPASSLTVSQIPDLLTQEKIKSNSVSSSSSRVSNIGALYFFENSDLKTNISQIIIAYYWALIKSSKSTANKGFFANNLFQFVMTYYFVFPLPESIIRAKLRERIIKILCFSLGKRSVAM